MFYLAASYYFGYMVTIQKTGGISAQSILCFFWPVCELQHYLYGAPFPIVKERKNVVCGVGIYLKRS